MNDAYYIVVFVSRTTRYWVSLALTTCAVVTAWGVCPQAQQPSGASAETSSEVSAAQRREAIARAWRDAKPTPVPLVGTEAAWTVTLPAPPSAPGALDDRRVYVPLRSNLLVALDRETGVLAWSRALETASPLLAADDSLYVDAGDRIQALNVLDFPLTANERGELEGEVVGQMVQRSQRRELLRQPFCVYLVDVLRPSQIPQPVFAKIPHCHAREE